MKQVKGGLGKLDDLKKQKEQISVFKKRADERNKALYSDLSSFKKGLFLILSIISVVLLVFLFLN